MSQLRRRRALYATVVLTLAYLLAYCDRTIVAILVGPIKTDLGFSDSRVALLIGFSFAIFYSLAGLPLGRLTDSVNRRNLILAGLLCWSAATAVCGLLQSFTSLFAARVCVGIGEACIVPAALSMIADYYGPQLRARAIAVFVCGAPLGSGAAYFLGGSLLHWLQQGTPRGLPLLTRFPWQLVFVVLGLAGLLVAALLALVKEPPRAGEFAPACEGSDRLSLVELLSTRRRLLICMIVGPSVTSIAAYALLAWGPALAARRFGWGPGDIAHWFTPLGIAAGLLGPWLGTSTGQRLIGAGRSDGMMRAVVWLGGAAVLLCVPAVLLPFAGPSIVLIFITSAVLLALITLPQVAIQYVMPGYLRGQVTALFAFTANIIGFGLGPTLVALLTDHVFQRESGLNLSLAFVCVAAVLAGSAMTGLQLPHYRAFVDAQDPGSEPAEDTPVPREGNTGLSATG